MLRFLGCDSFWNQIRKTLKMNLNEDLIRDYEAIDMSHLIVEEAMKLFPEPDLELLRMALWEASTLVSDFIEDLPELAEDFGLDKWIAAQKAKNNTVPTVVED